MDNSKSYIVLMDTPIRLLHIGERLLERKLINTMLGLPEDKPGKRPCVLVSYKTTGVMLVNEEQP